MYSSKSHDKLGQHRYPDAKSLSEVVTKTGYDNKEKYIYTGQQDANGNRHGIGICVFSIGAIYEGSFERDQICGYGRYIYSHGDYYIGEFKNGLRNGKGKY